MIETPSWLIGRMILPNSAVIKHMGTADATRQACQGPRIPKRDTTPYRHANYAAIRWRAPRLIIAAPFSAIMIVGALVLVEVTAGMTEASMTDRKSVV